MKWSTLLHLSFNMWGDQSEPRPPRWSPWSTLSPTIQFEEQLWHELSADMSARGLNHVVIDVGDAVRYASHPEIAVEGAWTPDRLRAEVVRLRSIGIEAVPKLNFATSHHAWLKQYSRMVSTPIYYRVVEDLIAETIEIFDSPALFHIGMDEETARHQASRDFLVVRQHGLFWHDINFYIDQVERHGVRAWMWGDHAMRTPDDTRFISAPNPDFFANVPRSVVLSHWYYSTHASHADAEAGGDWLKVSLSTFAELDRQGYDQIPCGSTFTSEENLANLASHCQGVISPERFLGMLMTTWKPCVDEFRDIHLRASDVTAAAMVRHTAARSAQR